MPPPLEVSICGLSHGQAPVALHFARAGLLTEAHAVALGHPGWPQVDDEGQDVEGEDEGNYPLEVGGDALLVSEGEDAKGDDEGDLDEDESELQPERGSEDAVLAVFDSETLILPADEDGTDQVPSNEEDQEDVVQLGMAPGIKDAQADQAHSSYDGENNRQGHQDFLAEGLIRSESSLVAQPALGGEREIEGDCRHDGAGDEERLEGDGADIRDVRQAHVCVEGGQAFAVDGHNPPEEHAE